MYFSFHIVVMTRRKRMKRDLMENLIAWKKDAEHRPLLLRGARQVGKTWLMKEFGSREYSKTAYVRFDHASPIRDVFASETNIENLLNAIQIHVGFKVTPKETLVIFDEIQECPGALASLKFFCEEAPDIDIIAAGSQLGLSDHVGIGFPVGKVDSLFLYPLSFKEFLEAIGKELFAELISKGDWKMLSAYHDECVRLLKLYFFIGGISSSDVSRYTFKEKSDHLGYFEFSNFMVYKKSNGSWSIPSVNHPTTNIRPIPATGIDDGAFFCAGIFHSDVIGQKTDYVIQIIDNMGTPDNDSDDVVYSLTRTATLNGKEAFELPRLDSGKWSLITPDITPVFDAFKEQVSW